MVMAQVRERWQVTLPREVRQSLDLHEGSDLLFIPVGQGAWLVKALPPRVPIPELLARFADEGPAPDLAQLHAAIGQALARELVPEEGNA